MYLRCLRGERLNDVVFVPERYLAVTGYRWTWALHVKDGVVFGQWPDRNSGIICAHIRSVPVDLEKEMF